MDNLIHELAMLYVKTNISPGDQPETLANLYKEASERIKNSLKKTDEEKEKEYEELKQRSGW
ncbi:hypothetical protein D3C76_865830 [compost metagenome]